MTNKKSIGTKIVNLKSAVRRIKSQREKNSGLYDYEKAYTSTKEYSGLENAYKSLIWEFKQERAE